MCLIVITPQQTAENAKRDLDRAMAALAEAQVAVISAVRTVEMFAHNFRVGAYQEREHKVEFDKQAIIDSITKTEEST